MDLMKTSSYTINSNFRGIYRSYQYLFFHALVTGMIFIGLAFSDYLKGLQKYLRTDRYSGWIKTSLFGLTFLAIVFGVLSPFMARFLKKDAFVWYVSLLDEDDNPLISSRTLNYVLYENTTRTTLLCYLGATMTLGTLFMVLILSKNLASKSSKSLNLRRKYFHAMAILMFIPCIYYDVWVILFFVFCNYFLKKKCERWNSCIWHSLSLSARSFWWSISGTSDCSLSDLHCMRFWILSSMKEILARLYCRIFIC